MWSLRSPWKTPVAVLAGMVLVSLGSAAVARRRLPVIDDPAADEIALVSIFSGTALRPTSTSFRGGSIVSAFGGTTLDLRRVTLADDAAHLRITTAYGGTEITVPDTWQIDVDGRTVLGGVTVRTPLPAIAGAPRLSIAATTTLGGLSVTARPVLRTAEERA